ncbi:hypothetical protein J2TS4_52620 [Paenibacillus sp. J2TS4]|nr:hypothetical protein J2TS4_52620 [Paenibacillus sp. J2TS4]
MENHAAADGMHRACRRSTKYGNYVSFWGDEYAEGTHGFPLHLGNGESYFFCIPIPRPQPWTAQARNGGWGQSGDGGCRYPLLKITQKTKRHYDSVFFIPSSA